MELAEGRYYYAGEEMNFLVFSDGACRTTYLETIRLQRSLRAVRERQTRPATELPLYQTVSRAEHVDDSAARREMPELLRELHGAEVRTAASTAQALETACERMSRTFHPKRRMYEEDLSGRLDGHSLESLNSARSSLRRS